MRLHQNKEQAVLRSLIVIIALMFTTSALAQERCKAIFSYSDINRTVGIDDIDEINRILARFLGRVERVPREENDYIWKELYKQESGEVSLDLDRVNALQGRRYYPAAFLRHEFAKVMQKVNLAAKGATKKNAMSHLIEVLSDVGTLYRTGESFFQMNKNRQPTAEIDQVEMLMIIYEAQWATASIMQCLLKGL
jgi:hypothetical protein